MDTRAKLQIQLLERAKDYLWMGNEISICSGRDEYVCHAIFSATWAVANSTEEDHDKVYVMANILREYVEEVLRYKTIKSWLVYNRIYTGSDYTIIQAYRLDFINALIEHIKKESI